MYSSVSDECLVEIILDGDEEIVEGTGPLIREAVKETEVDSITFQIVSL